MGLSMNEMTTYRWSFDEDLLKYREAGYTAIGVWLRKLRDFGEERAVELIEESGLEVSSVSWEGGFTGADASTAEENIASARDTLDLCAEIGAKCLVLYTGGRNGHTRRHAERLFRCALDQILPQAEEAGVPLAVEPMHPACADGWTFMTSLESALELVEEYETPALRVAIDTYHFPVEGPELAVLRELARYAAVVHLGDYSDPHGVDQARAPLGEGLAPLAKILDALSRGGYRGFCDVKLMGPEIGPCEYDELLRQSLSTFRELGRELGGVTPRKPTPTHADPCSTTWLSTSS